MIVTALLVTVAVVLALSEPVRLGFDSSLCPHNDWSLFFPVALFYVHVSCILISPVGFVPLTPWWPIPLIHKPALSAHTAFTFLDVFDAVDTRRRLSLVC